MYLKQHTACTHVHTHMHTHTKIFDILLVVQQLLYKLAGNKHKINATTVSIIKKELTRNFLSNSLTNHMKYKLIVCLQMLRIVTCILPYRIR